MNTISARKLFHVFFFDNTRDIAKGITTPMGETSAASGPVLARLTGPTGTERRAWCRSTRAKGRARGEFNRGGEADRTGQACAKLPQSQSARVPGRDACTAAGRAWEVGTKSPAHGRRAQVLGQRQDNPAERQKTSRTNLQPKAAMSSSTSESPASNTSAMRSAHKSRRTLLALWSSSEEVSSQQAAATVDRSDRDGGHHEHHPRHKVPQQVRATNGK